LKESSVPISSEQVKRLLTPVRADRVEKVRGQTYVPQFEVRAELNRVFGFGNWDSTIHSVTCIYEEPEDRTPANADKEVFYWRVCYRAACTLRIRDYWGQPICEHTEWHAEESAPQPNRGEAHALAITSVESYALRRAAINLGDTFGLHLYRDGQLGPLIRGTLQQTDPASPLYQETAPRAQDQHLTPEQQQALQSSLGAVVVSEEATEPQQRDEHESTPQP
jgi:hypothetical protein